MNGIIIVNKEKGFTSHDVVAKLRGILHEKKIGHTGTLDPDATGVLPVCIGKATKVCDLLTEKEKTYRTEIKLGITTDTLDMTGKILSRRDVSVTEQQIQEVLLSFCGEIQQVPPMYSAIKINGKKLYELARQGKEVERKPRAVTIHELKAGKMSLEENEFGLEVTCSKGTYIRSLCNDIGEQLGCGAAMKSLVRTRVGRFSIEQAKTLGEIQDAVEKREIDDLLLPVSEVFAHLRKCDVSKSAMRFLQNGNKVKPALCSVMRPEEREQVRMYGSDGEFYAIYEYREEDGMYRAVKMFHE